MIDEVGIDVAEESKAEQSDNEQNIIVNMEGSLAIGIKLEILPDFFFLVTFTRISLFSRFKKKLLEPLRYNLRKVENLPQFLFLVTFTRISLFLRIKEKSLGPLCYNLGKVRNLL